MIDALPAEYDEVLALPPEEGDDNAEGKGRSASAMQKLKNATADPRKSRRAPHEPPLGMYNFL